MREPSKTLAVSTGGVVAAFLGSLCCVGPLVFATVGVGAGLASRFEPLRPVFGVLMLAAFALAYRRAYPRPNAALATAGAEQAATWAIAPRDSPAACAVPVSRRRDRILFWSAATLSLALWTFPSWSRLFV